MSMRDWIIIGVGVAAAWYFSSPAGHDTLIAIGLGAGAGGATGGGGGGAGGTGAVPSGSAYSPTAAAAARAGQRPAPGQILNNPTLQNEPAAARDIATAPAAMVAAAATHYPYIGQAGVDTRTGRAVYFNGGNWDYGTYNPQLATVQSQQPSAQEHIAYRYDPNAPDATGANAYIRTTPGTIWSGRDPAVSP